MQIGLPRLTVSQQQDIVFFSEAISYRICQRSNQLLRYRRQNIAATETMRELMWLRQLLNSFGYHIDTPTLYCDSQPAIAIANTTGYHGRSKHLDVKYKYLAEVVANNEVRMAYVPTADMVADALTKPLPQTSFERCIVQMGLSA